MSKQYYSDRHQIESTSYAFFYELAGSRPYFYGFTSFWVYFSSWYKRVVQFYLFCMCLSSFPNTIYWRDCKYFSVYFYLLCYRLIDHLSKHLFLGSLFCPFDICVCFCACTMLFGLLLLSSIVWDQGVHLKSGQRTWKQYHRKFIRWQVTSPMKIKEIAKRKMRRCSTSLIIREMQIKTTVSYHLTPLKMGIIKKSTNNTD